MRSLWSPSSPDVLAAPLRSKQVALRSAWAPARRLAARIYARGKDGRGSCRRTALACSLHLPPSGSLTLRALGRPFAATRITNLRWR